MAGETPETAQQTAPEETLISEAGLTRRHQLIAILTGVAVALPAVVWGWSTSSALPVLAGVLLACLMLAWSGLLRIRLLATTPGLRLQAGFWFSETIAWDAVQQIRTGGRTQLISVLGRRRRSESTQYVVDGPVLRIVTAERDYVVSVPDARAAMEALSAHWPGDHTLRTLPPQERSTA